MTPVGDRVPRLTRRQVLVAGSVTTAAILLRPPGASAARAATTFAPPPTLPAPHDDLATFVADRMRAGRMPGVSAAIVEDGRVAWARGFGAANLWKDRPVRRTTPFMLASISKTVICTAVLQAVEDGMFALDDDVDTVLPFSVRLPSHPHRAITVRHLLTHTSGILDRWAVWDDLYTEGDSPVPLGAFLQDYLDPAGSYYRPANFSHRPPGTHYAYSNVGASLAAYLVEVAGGIGFDRWCDGRIFEPLGMRRTGWHLADLEADEVAMPYRWSPRTGRYEAFGQYGYPDYPDGALRTTATWIGAHMGMVMGGGRWAGTRVLRADSVRESLRPQLPGIAQGQGLIWYRFRLHGRELWGHNGGDQGVATVAFFDPHEGVGVVVLANADWRRSGKGWPLQQIMGRLFDEAPHLTKEGDR